MNKTQKLNRLAEIILTDYAHPARRYSIDIEYGDCFCEYIDQRNAQSIGWHLEIECDHDKAAARYLGKNYAIATRNLYGTIRSIVMEWEKEPLPTMDDLIPY